MRPVLLAALLIAVLTSTAHADRWTPATVQRAIATADAHWPASPCHGRHTITWLTGLELDTIADKPGNGGFATGPGLCQVWIAWDRIDPARVYRPGVYLCTILEHEFGHNAGYGHSTDPHDVMYADGNLEPAADCLAAFQPRRWWRLWRWHLRRRCGPAAQAASRHPSAPAATSPGRAALAGGHARHRHTQAA